MQPYKPKPFKIIRCVNNVEQTYDNKKYKIKNASKKISIYTDWNLKFPKLYTQQVVIN